MSVNEAHGALAVSAVMFALGSGWLANFANVPARTHQYAVDWWSRRNPIFYWPFSTYWPGLVPFWVWRLTLGLWFCGWAIALAIAAGRSF